MTTREDRVDLSQLGFEIRVPNQDSGSDHDDLGYDQAAPQYVTNKPVAPLRHQDEDGEYDIVPADDVSGVSASDYSLDDSEYSEDDDDDDDSAFRPRPITRKPMPTRTFPKRTLSGRRQRSNVNTADLGYEDLGYEPKAAAPPTQSQLGYGDEPAPPQLGYGTDDRSQDASSIRLLSVGRPVRNRRSMALGRRDTGSSHHRTRRYSTASGSTASSFGSNKMRRAHSKSRPSQREKMVSRTTNRRLSRKHPAQVNVSTTSAESEVSAVQQQTLQDLGCSELVLDPRRTRMPKRVSMEYGPGDGNDSMTAPKCISLEFDHNPQSAWMPRRVSIEFDQRSGHGRSRSRRRGSLDFSVGTSTLPRRGSMSQSQQQQQLSPRPPAMSHEQRAKSCGECGRPNQRRQTMDLGSACRRSSAAKSPKPPIQRVSRTKLQPMPTLSPPEFKRASSCGAPQLRRFSNMMGQTQSYPPGHRSVAAARRGSLGHSVGTCQLPRRTSMGGASLHSAAAAPSLEPPAFNRSSSTPLQRSRSPARNNSDNSKSRASMTSRRSSIAHIPRKQIQNKVSPKPHRQSLNLIKQTTTLEPAKQQLQSLGVHRLSLSHVGAVQYLTRDTHHSPAVSIGRSA